MSESNKRNNNILDDLDEVNSPRPAAGEGGSGESGIADLLFIASQMNIETQFMDEFGENYGQGDNERRSPDDRGKPESPIDMSVGGPELDLKCGFGLHTIVGGQANGDNNPTGPTVTQSADDGPGERKGWSKSKLTISPVPENKLKSTPHMQSPLGHRVASVSDLSAPEEEEKEGSGKHPSRKTFVDGRFKGLENEERGSSHSGEDADAIFRPSRPSAIQNNGDNNGELSSPLSSSGFLLKSHSLVPTLNSALPGFGHVSSRDSVVKSGSGSQGRENSPLSTSDTSNLVKTLVADGYSKAQVKFILRHFIRNNQKRLRVFVKGRNVQKVAQRAYWQLMKTYNLWTNIVKGKFSRINGGKKVGSITTGSAFLKQFSPYALLSVSLARELLLSIRALTDRLYSLTISYNEKNSRRNSNFYRFHQIETEDQSRKLTSSASFASLSPFTVQGVAEVSSRLSAIIQKGKFEDLSRGIEDVDALSVDIEHTITKLYKKIFSQSSSNHQDQQKDELDENVWLDEQLAKATSLGLVYGGTEGSFTPLTGGEGQTKHSLFVQLVHNRIAKNKRVSEEVSFVVWNHFPGSSGHEDDSNSDSSSSESDVEGFSDSPRSPLTTTEGIEGSWTDDFELSDILKASSAPSSGSRKHPGSPFDASFGGDSFMNDSFDVLANDLETSCNISSTQPSLKVESRGGHELKIDAPRESAKLSQTNSVDHLLRRNRTHPNGPQQASSGRSHSPLYNSRSATFVGNGEDNSEEEKGHHEGDSGFSYNSGSAHSDVEDDEYQFSDNLHLDSDQAEDSFDARARCLMDVEPLEMPLPTVPIDFAYERREQRQESTVDRSNQLSAPSLSVSMFCRDESYAMDSTEAGPVRRAIESIATESVAERKLRGMSSGYGRDLKERYMSLSSYLAMDSKPSDASRTTRNSPSIPVVLDAFSATTDPLEFVGSPVICGRGLALKTQQRQTKLAIREKARRVIARNSAWGSGGCTDEGLVAYRNYFGESPGKVHKDVADSDTAASRNNSQFDKLQLKTRLMTGAKQRIVTGIKMDLFEEATMFASITKRKMYEDIVKQYIDDAEAASTDKSLRLERIKNSRRAQRATRAQPKGDKKVITTRDLRESQLRSDVLNGKGVEVVEKKLRSVGFDLDGDDRQTQEILQPYRMKRMKEAESIRDILLKTTKVQELEGTGVQDVVVDRRKIERIAKSLSKKQVDHAFPLCHTEIDPNSISRRNLELQRKTQRKSSFRVTKTVSSFDPNRRDPDLQFLRVIPRTFRPREVAKQCPLNTAVSMQQQQQQQYQEGDEMGLMEEQQTWMATARSTSRSRTEDAALTVRSSSSSANPNLLFQTKENLIGHVTGGYGDPAEWDIGDKSLKQTEKRRNIEEMLKERQRKLQSMKKTLNLQEQEQEEEGANGAEGSTASHNTSVCGGDSVLVSESSIQIENESNVLNAVAKNIRRRSQQRADKQMRENEMRYQLSCIENSQRLDSARGSNMEYGQGQMDEDPNSTFNSMSMSVAAGLGVSGSSLVSVPSSTIVTPIRAPRNSDELRESMERIRMLKAMRSQMSSGR